jgi:hypothetical protein
MTKWRDKVRGRLRQESGVREKRVSRRDKVTRTEERNTKIERLRWQSERKAERRLRKREESEQLFNRELWFNEIPKIPSKTVKKLKAKPSFTLSWNSSAPNRSRPFQKNAPATPICTATPYSGAAGLKKPLRAAIATATAAFNNIGFHLVYNCCNV